MGFWETTLDPHSPLVTESSELHFNSLKEQNTPAFTRVRADEVRKWAHSYVNPPDPSYSRDDLDNSAI